jgi:hypothetical protein
LSPKINHEQHYQLFKEPRKMLFTVILQSNGKLERYHKTIKGTCIRVRTPLTLDDAQRLVAEFVEHYNNKRLHSAIGYITPADKLAGRDEAIFAAREAKLNAARDARKATRKAS